MPAWQDIQDRCNLPGRLHDSCVPVDSATKGLHRRLVCRCFAISLARRRLYAHTHIHASCNEIQVSVLRSVFGRAEANTPNWYTKHTANDLRDVVFRCGGADQTAESSTNSCPFKNRASASFVVPYFLALATFSFYSWHNALALLFREQLFSRVKGTRVHTKRRKGTRI